MEAATLLGTQTAKGETPPRLMDVSPMSERLFDVSHRLLDLLHNPLDALALGEPTIRELVYRTVQNGPQQALLELATSRSAASVLQAVRSLRDSYDQDVSVEELARQVGMSVSSFHEHFKRITSHPPLQYLKGIRAQRLGRATRRDEPVKHFRCVQVRFRSRSSPGPDRSAQVTPGAAGAAPRGPCQNTRQSSARLAKSSAKSVG